MEFRLPSLPSWLRRRTDEDREPPRLRVTRRTVLYVLGGVTAVLLVSLLSIDRSIVHRFETRKAALPSRVYARPFEISRGGKIDRVALFDQLSRSGYVEVQREPERPGEFLRDGNDWVVFTRSTLAPSGMKEASLVDLDVRWGRLRRITDRRTREHLDDFALEPEPLITFYAEVMEERRWTLLEDIPENLRQAVEVVEDRRFRNHHGIDLVGIVRALVANVAAGRVVQGGSTITQQLVKNLKEPGERTLLRKLSEAAAAFALELHYDKDAILEAYLNEVYLDQLGPVSVSGVGDASRFFFGAHVRDLDLPQSALLAGMIRTPGRYNPRRHPDAARDRRDLVLRLMAERGVIEEPELRQAVAAPLGIVDASTATGRFPWIEDYLAGAVASVVPGAVPSRAGYSIFTTFDPRIQRAAREALEAGLNELESRLGRDAEGPLEGAIVVLRPDDGAMLALVGGRDYGRSQYNRGPELDRGYDIVVETTATASGLDEAVRLCRRGDRWCCSGRTSLRSRSHSLPSP